MLSNIKAARMLGWASFAVGLTEILATRWLEEQMGVDDHHALLRAFGGREIAAGATIVSQPGLNKTVASGMWARVAGDAADIAMLGLAAKSTRKPRGLAAITALVVGITGLDILVATRIQSDLARAKRVAMAGRQSAMSMRGNDGHAFPAPQIAAATSPNA